MASSSSRHCKNVCVFCSPLTGKDFKFTEEAIKVGNTLANEGVQIIYGGGSMGLMGAVATAAYTEGASIMGIIPKVHKPLYGRTWGREVLALTTQDRIAKMYQAADAFVVLPGGLDTLEELACVTSWSTSTMHRKPVCFLNVKGYFNHLFSFLDNAVENGFMSPDARKVMFGANTIEELLHRLRTYEHYSGQPTARFSVPEIKMKESDDQGLDLNLSL